MIYNAAGVSRRSKACDNGATREELIEAIRELGHLLGLFLAAVILAAGARRVGAPYPVFLALEPEEIFFRAFRHAEFDICELSLSSSTVKTAQGDFAYVGVPAFVSRAFRHTSIYVRRDRI